MCLLTAILHILFSVNPPYNENTVRTKGSFWVPSVEPTVSSMTYFPFNRNYEGTKGVGSRPDTQY